MLKRVLGFIITVSCITSAYAQSVAAHYTKAQTIHQAEGNEGLSYTIKKVGNGYKTIDPGGEYTVPVVVDDKNGFLSFEDTGTGGGTLSAQAAIFKGNGKSFLVYKQFSYDGVMSELYVHIYDIESGYKEVTNNVLPTPALNRLFSSPFGDDEIKPVAAVFCLNFDIPRYGTTAKYTINKEAASQFCKDNETDACKYLSKVKATEIALKWNKENNQFEEGK